MVVHVHHVERGAAVVVEIRQARAGVYEQCCDCQVPLLGGIVQRRVPSRPCGVRVRAVLEQQRHQRQEAEFRSDVQRRAATVVDRVRGGAALEEEPRHCVCGGRVRVFGQREDDVQGRVARHVFGVDARGDLVAAVEQHAEIPRPLPARGPVQRGAAVDVGVGDAGALGQQQRDHVPAAVGRGLVQRGRGSRGQDADTGAAGEQQADGGETARLHGAVQGRLAVVTVGGAADVDGEAGGEGGGDQPRMAVQGGPEERVHAVFVEEGELLQSRQQQPREAPVRAQEGIEVARAGEAGGDEKQELVWAGEERHCG